jgi:hypothetical protein
MAGCLLARSTYFPIFSALTALRQPGAEKAQAQAPSRGRRSEECSFQFNPAHAKFTTRATSRRRRSRHAVNYANEAAPRRVGAGEIGDTSAVAARETAGRRSTSARRSDQGRGYPASADPTQINNRW